MRKFPLVCLTLCALASPLRAETVQFQEKPWDALANRDVGAAGAAALAVRPKAWLHGETPNWILHYRRITEAKRVALEIDFHIKFIVKTLGATPGQIAHKAHVFIFEDDKDWKEFVIKGAPLANLPAWAASFAYGEDLFLNVRNGTTGVFDSGTLAHEETHAVIARIFPRKTCPLWLNEGFAEQMRGQSVAARMGQYNSRLMEKLPEATMPLDTLIALKDYPTETAAVNQLYQSAEKVIRFLMTDVPADRFPKLFNALMDGEDLPSALPKIYPEKYPTYDAFTQRYQRLAK